MATIIKPPNPLPKGFSVFLAGSIEMGTSENWQNRFEQSLAQSKIVIFNPRRDDWNPLWSHNKDNSHFHEQVIWELEALEKADIIALYFDPDTKSPIKH